MTSQVQQQLVKYTTFDLANFPTFLTDSFPDGLEMV